MGAKQIARAGRADRSGVSSLHASLLLFFQLLKEELIKKLLPKKLLYRRPSLESASRTFCFCHES